MKRLNILLVVSISWLFTDVVRAQNSGDQTFTIKGEVHSEIGQQLPSSILVYEENDVSDEVKVRRNGKFKLKLDANAYYTLSFYMPLHQVKKVIVSTEGVDRDVEFLDDTFECDIYLYDDHSLKKLNKDLLDFPTAMLQYSEDDRQLTVNRAYTTYMYEQEDKLINEEKNEWVSDAAVGNE